MYCSGSQNAHGSSWTLPSPHFARVSRVCSSHAHLVPTAAAKEAGALWIASGVLFLMPSSAKQFLPFLREKFPRLVRQYESWYTHNAYAPEPYRQKVAARLASIKSELGFTVRP